MKKKERLKYEKILRDLTLMSDTFSAEIFKNKECAQHLFRTLLQDESIRLKRVEVQKEITNMWGKGVRFDVYGISDTGDVYDAEIQNKLSEASVNRAAYNGALMAMRNLKKGLKFKKKGYRKKFHVAFVTNGDALGYGQSENHISYYCKENMEKIDAGADIHYYNSQIHDDSPIGRMMHDFHEKCVDAMQDEVFQKYVRYYKETPKGRKHMCKVMEKIRRDGYKDGEKTGYRKGENHKSKMIARSLYNSGMPIQEIMIHTHESEQQIRKWVKA